MDDDIPHVIVDPNGEPEEPATLDPWPMNDPPPAKPERDPRLDRPFEPHPWGEHV